MTWEPRGHCTDADHLQQADELKASSATSKEEEEEEFKHSACHSWPTLLPWLLRQPVAADLMACMTPRRMEAEISKPPAVAERPRQRLILSAEDPLLPVRSSAEDPRDTRGHCIALHKRMVAPFTGRANGQGGVRTSKEEEEERSSNTAPAAAGRQYCHGCSD